MIILGPNAYHSDASVVLIWSAEEEHYSWIKQASGFPVLVLRACLEENPFDPTQIRIIAISKDPRANFLRKMLYVFSERSKSSLVFDRLKALKRSSEFQKYFSRAFGHLFSKLKAHFIRVEYHDDLTP